MPERERHPVGVPSWVDLTTDDLDASGHFYRSVFGWTIEAVEPAGLPEGSRGYSWLTLRGRRVAALAPHLSPGSPGWCTYIEVDSCEDVVAAAVAAGATVAVEPMPVGDFGVLALLTDPQGAHFGLWQSGEHTGAGIVNEPGSLCWNQLATTDVDAAVAFYSRLFGWELNLVDLGPDVPPYHMVALGAPVAGITEISHEPDGTPPPSWRGSDGDQPRWIAHFAVADCDAATERVVANGGAVVSPPADSMAGRGASCRDPQGAYFGIVAMAEGIAGD